MNPVLPEKSVSVVTVRRIARALRYRFHHLIARLPIPQLELALPAERTRLEIGPLPYGYAFRVLTEEDAPRLAVLLRRAGFAEFDEGQVRNALYACVPRGCFGIEDERGALVATMMARHMADERHPRGGRIDWLACDPLHVRRGLGMAVAAAAMNRLIEIGYRDIWVTTDDHRLAALKVFLRLGFVPVIYAPGQPERWERVLTTLGFDPAAARPQGALRGPEVAGAQRP